MVTRAVLATFAAGAAHAAVVVTPDLYNPSASYIIRGDVNGNPFYATDVFAAAVYDGISWARSTRQ